MENNNEVKRTQGEWVIGYGHTSNCLGIFTKKMIDEGIKDNPICLITPIENMNETDKINAEFICKAVNEYDKLKEDNAAMLNILQRINNVISIPAASKVFSHDLQIAIKKAIKQAENK